MDDTATNEEQRTVALRDANRVRRLRKRLKDDIASGRRNPIRVLKKPPEYAEGMSLEKFLISIPGIAEVKARRLLYLCRIAPGTTLGSLTDPQRIVVARGIKEKTWLRA